MYLIVGIDPGTTTSIATLNFKGELIELFSSKNFGLNEIIKYLISKGKVSIIATDVSPCPESVSRVAIKLGAKLFMPKEILSVHEKIILTRKHNPKDSHQRDALAAAITAFNTFTSKFQKIDSLEFNNDFMREEIKHLVTQGISIERAKLELEKRREEEEEKKKISPLAEKPTKIETLKFGVENKMRNEKIKKLNEQIFMLRKEILEKEERIGKLEKLIRRLKEKYNAKLKKDNEIAKRDRTIRNLETLIKMKTSKLEKMDNLKNLWGEVARKKVIPLCLFPNNKAEIVLIKNRLRKRDLGSLDGVKIAFTQDKKNIEYLEEREILVGDMKKVKELLGFYYINAEDLSDTTKKKRIISLEEIIEDYRGRKK